MGFGRRVVWVIRPVRSHQVGDFFFGVRLWAFAMLLTILGGLFGCIPTKQAHSQGMRRLTASELALPQNAAALRQITERCQRDPGGTQGDPDCTNAFYARAEVLERQFARHNATDLTPPWEPRYWKTRPAQRLTQLRNCHFGTTAGAHDPYFLRVCRAAGWQG